jgi:hypothetical protein
MQVNGLEGLTAEEIRHELQQGARFVVFDYCVSVVVMSFQRCSDVYFVRADESTLLKSMPYTLLSLVVGWWGIPWGPIYTVSAIATNLRGGRDVTKDILGGGGSEPSVIRVPAPASG